MGFMTKLFSNSKTDWNKPFSEKLAKRVSRIPTGELEMWADQALYEIGRCLSGYAKSRDKYYLDEGLNGAEALHAVINELNARMTKV